MMRCQLWTIYISGILLLLTGVTSTKNTLRTLCMLFSCAWIFRVLGCLQNGFTKRFRFNQSVFVISCPSSCIASMSIVLKFLSLLHGISGTEGMRYILGGALFLWIRFATVLVIFCRNFWLHKTWNRPFLALQPCNIGALQRQMCAKRTSMPLAEPGRGEGGPWPP